MCKLVDICFACVNWGNRLYVKLGKQAMCKMGGGGVQSMYKLGDIGYVQNGGYRLCVKW